MFSTTSRLFSDPHCKRHKIFRSSKHLWTNGLSNFTLDLHFAQKFSSSLVLLNSISGQVCRRVSHSSSSPDPGKVQRPSRSNFAQADTEPEFVCTPLHYVSGPQSVSMNVAMKMILVEKLSCCGSLVNPATRTRLALWRCRRADDILGSRCSSIFHRGSVLNGNPMPCTHRLPLDRNDCIIHELQDKENQHSNQNVPSANENETCLMLFPPATPNHCECYMLCGRSDRILRQLSFADSPQS